jgi:L-lactate dehydrogenase complex protein LldG
MQENSREKILNKIKKALQVPTAKPFVDLNQHAEIFNRSSEDLDIVFAEQFVSLQGKFVYCLDDTELLNQLTLLTKQQKWNKIFCKEEGLRNRLPFNWFSDLAGCDVSITTCEMLVARTGSIVLSAAQTQGRTASVYAPVHITVAYTQQLVPDIEDALKALQKKYGNQLPSFISFASGPSRTADIEKTLVTGVHGPKEVYCFLVEG